MIYIEGYFLVNTILNLKFDVSAVQQIAIVIYWGMTLHSVVRGYHHSGTTYCPSLHCNRYPPYGCWSIVPFKCWYPYTKLHGDIIQNTTFYFCKCQKECLMCVLLFMWWLRIGSYGSVVDIVTTPQAWQLKILIQFLARCKRFLSSPKCPAWLWAPPSPLFTGYQALFPPGVKWQGCEAGHLPGIVLSLKNASLLRHIFRLAQEQLYFVN
jgi:hypothetical protein